VLKKADPEKQRKYLEDFKKLQKRYHSGQLQYILFQDESMIRDYQAIMKTWFSKGKQRLIPTYGKHKGAKLIGCMDWATGEVFVAENERYTAVEFLAFLNEVLAKYPEGNICMILDNARIHHAKLLEGFLKSNPRLELTFLPPYSPNLNMIEGYWGWLKNSVINNDFFSKFYYITLAVRKFVAWTNEHKDLVIDRLCCQY
jgi:transposase